MKTCLILIICLFISFISVGQIIYSTNIIDYGINGLTITPYTSNNIPYGLLQTKGYGLYGSQILQKSLPALTNSVGHIFAYVDYGSNNIINPIPPPTNLRIIMGLSPKQVNGTDFVNQKNSGT